MIKNRFGFLNFHISSRLLFVVLLSQNACTQTQAVKDTQFDRAPNAQHFDEVFGVTGDEEVKLLRKALAEEDPPSARLPIRRLKQLTGRIHWPLDGEGWHVEDLADPSIPTELKDKSIRVTGSGWGSLNWDGWDSFLRGAQPAWVHHDYALPNGELMNDEEYPWDANIENIGGTEILYGGAITSRTGNPSTTHARFEPDHLTRRVYPFTRDSRGWWVRSAKSLFGMPDKSNWIGHNYGHQFIQDDEGKWWVFYEKVDDVSINGGPNRTEIFATTMLDAFNADSSSPVASRPVISVGSPYFPATNRGVDQLSEGPRPARVTIKNKDFIVVGYSSSGWQTPKYSLNFAAVESKKIGSAYHPQLTADKSDLLDVGLQIKKRYGMTWGPGRPALFQDPGKNWWVLFHARYEGMPKDYRNIYLAPVEMKLGSDGYPKVSLLDGNKIN